MSALTNQQIDSARNAEALVRLLADTDSEVPPRLRERILSFGPAVVSPLVDLVNTIITDIDEPNEGPEAMHAIDLLTELRAPEAVEPLLRVLRDTRWDTHVHDLILRQLPQIGAPALEPTLAAHDAATDPDVIDDFCTVLAGLKVRDERIYERLVSELERNVELAAMNLAEYGDPRALPHLSAALDRFELVDSPDLMANHPAIELEAAIQELGGEPTPEQSQKASRARTMGRLNSRRLDALLKHAVSRADPETASVPMARAALAEPRPARAARKVGRNDPCPCGSGNKYKKCCLGKR